MRNNFTPVMVIDAETVAKHPRALDIVEHLSDRRHDPGWSRERACFGCIHWKTKDGLGNLPFRPGRGSAAVEGCSGCWYSMLDYAQTVTPDVDTSEKLRVGWLSILERPRKARRPPTRMLRYDTVDHQQGYTGKRQARSAPAFMPPNRVGEVSVCGCGGKATVERYWSLGKDKDEPQRFVAISCMAGCPRVTKPEGEWAVTPAPAKSEEKKR